MTAGYFLGGAGGKGGKGGKEGIFPPLTAVFPHFRLAVIIVYYIFQKILHPQDPLPPARKSILFPPLQISLDNIYPPWFLARN